MDLHHAHPVYRNRTHMTIKCHAPSFWICTKTRVVLPEPY
nr:MAG TPA: hypothetical protein [Caudoviricetes sp.]